jgi:hypothetical protein
LAIDVASLKAERETLKTSLRELENEQRKVLAEQKKLRQREIQTKRTIEALDTLIEMQESEGKQESEG